MRLCERTCLPAARDWYVTKPRHSDSYYQTEPSTRRSQHMPVCRLETSTRPQLADFTAPKLHGVHIQHTLLQLQPLQYFQNWPTTLGPTSQIPPHRHISDFLRTPRPEAPASNHEASSAFRNMYTRVQVQPYLNLKQGTCSARPC